MEVLLIWGLVWLVVEWSKLLSKKLNRKISPKIFSVWLSLVAWAVYYFVQLNDPKLIEQAVVTLWGIFATSQVVWMFFDSVLPKK